MTFKFMPIACTYTQEAKYRGMRGKPKEFILSLNVLPNGKHIGHKQNTASINLNNHAFGGEKIQEFQLTENKWAQVYISGNYFIKHYGQYFKKKNPSGNLHKKVEKTTPTNPNQSK